jgi:hypothetical protein
VQLDGFVAEGSRTQRETMSREPDRDRKIRAPPCETAIKDVAGEIERQPAV